MQQQYSIATTKTASDDEKHTIIIGHLLVLACPLFNLYAASNVTQSTGSFAIGLTFSIAK